MAESGGFGDAFEFLRLIWAVDHSLQRMSRQLVRKLGVTGPQRLTIRAIGKLQPVTSADLAGLLHLHPSTLTVIVAALEKGGYVVRSPDERDRRRLLLKLTPKGRAIERAGEGTIEAAVQKALDAATKGEVEVSRRLLTRISGVLDREADARSRGRIR